MIIRLPAPTLFVLPEKSAIGTLKKSIFEKRNITFNREKGQLQILATRGQKNNAGKLLGETFFFYFERISDHWMFNFGSTVILFVLLLKIIMFGVQLTINILEVLK